MDSIYPLIGPVLTAKSATGFTVALVNNSSSARNIGCYWIAM